MSDLKFIAVAIGVAGLLVVLASGCGRSPFSRTQAEDKNKPDPAVPVEVAAIARGAIEGTVKGTANLEAEAEVKVFARTSNRVTELLVEEGLTVEKGAVLLRLEDDLQRTQVSKAEVRLEKATQEFQRQKALFDQKLISEQMFHDAQFDLKQLELALEDARRELEYTVVRAPIAGTISRRLVKYGDLVNVNQHLFDIVDFESMVARVYVPERELALLEVGQLARVTATAAGPRVYRARVERIAPVVESKTGLVKITVAFEEIGALRPGMYVDVEIVTATRTDALLLSKRSLVYDGDQLYVYRLLPERKVERVLVEPRLADALHIEPAGGFNEGDLIVVAGQTGLKDAARVRLPEDPDPAEKEAAGEDASLSSAK
ncbi:MAG: efflux RND transporter periplasmic adaptor subunit [Verrucomicrobia bacterium]|nr:efflux RND transporter periplasmic adaptor subunit [Verrucomicrobiota bacterium]